MSNKNYTSTDLKSFVSTSYATILLTIPILFAFFPIGLAFGVLAVDLGIEWYFTLLLSFIVYAGSSEFIIAAMMSKHEPIYKIMLTCFLVNFRHIFYGLSVFDKIPQSGPGRHYTIATLSDETYALIANLKNDQPESALIIAALNHFYWFGSVFCGVWLGKVLNIQIEGLDFCLTALFIVLTVEQWKHLKSGFPMMIGVISALLSLLIFPDQMLLSAIGLSVFFMFFVFKKSKSSEEKA